MGKRAAVRRFSDSEASAKLRNVRTSPGKLNLVADLIRGLKAEEALIQLEFCKRRIAHQVRSLLQSAIANAENNHDLDIDRLVVAEVNVGKALVMKRFKARARGRGARIFKPFSNIEIIVREQEEELA